MEKKKKDAICQTAVQRAAAVLLEGPEPGSMERKYYFSWE